MKLSDHFMESEFLFSETAEKYGVKNTWDSPIHKKNAIILCTTILEPIRAKFGPIKITSGYRNQVINKLVGGVENSLHLLGKAVDIFPLAKVIRLIDIFDFLKVTHKGGLAIKPNEFIHVDNGRKRRWTY